MYKIGESGDKMSETSQVKKKRKFRNPPSGYKLGDAMPESLRAIGLEYRESVKRDKLRKSNNKGDQRYGRANNSTRRTN